MAVAPPRRGQGDNDSSHRLKPCAANEDCRGCVHVPYRDESARCELSSITRPPHHARERLLFGRRRLVRNCGAPEVVRELYGACVVPPSSHRRAERALQRREVIRRTLCVRLSYFSMHRTMARGAYLVMLHYNGGAYDSRLRRLWWLVGKPRSVRR